MGSARLDWSELRTLCSSDQLADGSLRAARVIGVGPLGAYIDRSPARL